MQFPNTQTRLGPLWDRHRYSFHIINLTTIYRGSEIETVVEIPEVWVPTIRSVPWGTTADRYHIRGPLGEQFLTVHFAFISLFSTSSNKVIHAPH